MRNGRGREIKKHITEKHEKRKNERKHAMQKLIEVKSKEMKAEVNGNQEMETLWS